MVSKACPIVLRRCNFDIEILAFEHPSALRQLVKGTIEANELPSVAAVRELVEESGLSACDSPRFLAYSGSLPDADGWYFYVCEVIGHIPESWTFYTEDDGGLDFRFFWHNLNCELDEGWHPLFHKIMAFIRPLILSELNDIKH